jgi:hypothetical protein
VVDVAAEGFDVAIRGDTANANSTEPLLFLTPIAPAQLGCCRTSAGGGLPPSSFDASTARRAFVCRGAAITPKSNLCARAVRDAYDRPLAVRLRPNDTFRSSCPRRAPRVVNVTLDASRLST